MNTKVLILLAILLAVPCLAKVTVREYAMPAVQGFPYQPAVSGDWVVALLNTEQNNVTSTVGVIAYDLKNKKVFTIYQGKVTDLAFTGTTVMWAGAANDVPSLHGIRTHSSSFCDLVIYDLSTDRYSSPPCSITGVGLSAFGNLVTFENGSTIWMYNRSNNEHKRISDAARNHHCTDMFGDMVMWCEYKGTQTSRIRGYRISTGEELLLTDDYESNPPPPRTDGKYVVWSTNGIGTRVYDLKTGQIRVIKLGSLPDVSDGIAVYTRSLKTGVGKRFVYGMDLKTGEEFQISKGQPERQPRIEGNRAVWVEGSVLHCADIDRLSELQLHNK